MAVAGKVFDTDNASTSAIKVFHEIIKMLHVNDRNIVQCKGVAFLPNRSLPVLLMERLETNLHTYVLQKGNSDLPRDSKVSILFDTASGLHYLHSHKYAIIHRDLTAKNVLLDSQLRAKITDFSNSRIMDPDDTNINAQKLTHQPGTLVYMLPEALESVPRYSFSLDVFSFGHLSVFTITQAEVTVGPLKYKD